MIAITKKTKISNLTNIWFDEYPKLKGALFNFLLYKQCKNGKNIFGFVKKEFYTKIIELRNKNDQQLLESFSTNTKYKINRAKKEGVICVEHFGDLDDFVKYYNQFAREKNKLLINNDYLKLYQQNIVITKAEFENEIIVMHSYLIDFESDRARLFHSASHFRNESDSHKRNLIGRANRLLHFEDMKIFQAKGIHIYDLGGYAHMTDDKEKKAINEFKDGFNGELLLEYDFTSWPLFFYEHFFSKLIKPFKKN
ncbi:MAG: hypothetical protein HQK51_11430 [Oligoflexia bacterium]|nr:hypothetical protein [Oligoflexia bacterium]